MAETSGPISRTCPTCGVALPMGYVKCPRCQSDLSSPVELARARSRQRTDGGGTALDDRAGNTTIVLGAAAIAGVIALVYFVVRDPSASTAATAIAIPDAQPADEPVPYEPVADDPAPSRPVPPPPPDDPGPSPTAALGQLARDLRAEKLWATVGQDRDAVVIGSSFCDDAGLLQILDAHAGDLRAARFTAVVCRAPHGGLVFERAL